MALFVGEFPWLGEFHDTNEGDVDAAGIHAFPLPIEAFADGLLRVNMVGKKGGDLIPVCQSDGLQGLCVVTDRNGISRLPLRHRVKCPFADVIALSMKARGEEKKRRVSK